MTTSALNQINIKYFSLASSGKIYFLDGSFLIIFFASSSLFLFYDHYLTLRDSVFRGMCFEPNVNVIFAHSMKIKVLVTQLIEFWQDFIACLTT